MPSSTKTPITPFSRKRSADPTNMRIKNLQFTQHAKSPIKNSTSKIAFGKRIPSAVDQNNTQKKINPMMLSQIIENAEVDDKSKWFLQS